MTAADAVLPAPGSAAGEIVEKERRDAVLPQGACDPRNRARCPATDDQRDVAEHDDHDDHDVYTLRRR